MSAATHDVVDIDLAHLEDTGATADVESRPQTPFAVLDRGVAGLAKWSLRLLLITLALVVIGYVLGTVWSVVFPLVLAIILSTVLWPLAKKLRRVMPAALAALLTLVGFLAAIVAVFGFMIPVVASEAGDLSAQVQEGVENLQTTLSEPPLNLDAEQVSDMIDSAITWLQENSQQIATGVLSGVTSVGSGLIVLLLALVLTFFFIKDGPRFIPWMGVWLGRGPLHHAEELSSRIWSAVGGFIWSQTAVAFVDALFIGLGLWLLDVPFALPLAVLIFFAAYIPIVGAVTTGALAVLVALVAHDFTKALIVLGLILLVQQLEGNVLQPVLVGRTLKIHPAVVIAAVAMGGGLAGIAGAFLAVPVTAVLIVVARYARESVRGDQPEFGNGGSPPREPFDKPPGDDDEEVGPQPDESATGSTSMP